MTRADLLADVAGRTGEALQRIAETVHAGVALVVWDGNSLEYCAHNQCPQRWRPLLPTLLRDVADKIEAQELAERSAVSVSGSAVKP